MKSSGSLSAVALVLAMAGCTTPRAAPAPAPAPAEFLIRFAPPPAGDAVIRLTAEASGRLVHRDGCLRIVSERRPDVDMLVVWPTDYAAVSRGGRHGVMAPDGRTAFDGDRVRLGGGAIDALSDRVLHRDRAERCGGPYFGGYLPD